MSARGDGGGWRSGGRWLALGLVAGWLLGAGVVRADQVAEDPAESRVRALAKELRCAVCQNQSLYDSNSDLAKDMLKVIREKVAAGESDAAINDYFYARYGDYIYLEPVWRGGNWLLWLGPFLGLALGGAGLWVAIGRWRQGRDSRAGEAVQQGNSPASDSSAPPPGVTAAVHERVQRELERVEL